MFARLGSSTVFTILIRRTRIHVYGVDEDSELHGLGVVTWVTVSLLRHVTLLCEGLLLDLRMPLANIANILLRSQELEVMGTQNSDGLMWQPL